MQIETKNGQRFIWPYQNCAFVFDGVSLTPIGPFPTREIANQWAEEYFPPNTDWAVHSFDTTEDQPIPDSNPMDEFKSLANQLQAIIDDPDLNWETKFDLGFKLRRPIEVALDSRIEWYDPDTTCEEDILAFNAAVQKRLNR